MKGSVQVPKLHGINFRFFYKDFTNIFKFLQKIKNVCKNFVKKPSPGKGFTHVGLGPDNLLRRALAAGRPQSDNIILGDKFGVNVVVIINVKLNNF